MVLRSEDFLRRREGRERPEQLWAAFTVGHGRGYVRSRGMAYVGAPDVATRLAGDDLNDKVSMLAGLCHELAGGHLPVSGETVTYELGGQEQTFRMFELGSGWWLGSDHPDEAQSAHHAGMWLAASERLIMRRVGFIDGLDSPAPPHYIDVFTGLGTAMVTNGLSLASQPGGTPQEGNERVELMCRLDRDAGVHGRMLSVFGGMMFEQDGSRPFRAWDGIRNAPDTGFPAELENLILVPREPLVIWPGHQATLLQVVAVAADEYDQLRNNPDGGARWLQERDAAKDWASYHARFNAFVR